MHLMQRHPKNHVFGLVDRPEAVASILQDLERKGIAEESVQIIHSQEDAQTTEPAERGQPLEIVARAAEKLSEEHEFNELYESKLESGEFLVGIPTSDLMDKETAQVILHENGAHSINFYGQWVVEELET